MARQAAREAPSPPPAKAKEKGRPQAPLVNQPDGPAWDMAQNLVLNDT